MTNAATNTAPASPQFEKFVRLLKELFMFDQADLDFGIYRIMNAKRDEITGFLEKDLLPQVRQTLGELESGDRKQVEDELAKAEAAARAAGFEPDQSPKVQQLRAKLDAAGGGLDATEAEVYSDLYNFFRRYYHEGDFISQRRYKEGVYAIPYEGEEVKLYWANHDQYYIKSSENFRNYSFKVKLQLPGDDESQERRVTFKLVDADTERDNNRAAAGKERRFLLADEDPLVEQDDELFIRFEYHPPGDKAKQDSLNAAAVERILNYKPEPAEDVDSEAAGLADANPFAAWQTALMAKAPTESNQDRTLLARHLAEYTARNTFDYFIHKDLGGFLRRELDFYIKNEIVHLDDIEHETAPRVEQYLAKVKAIRRIAHKIIDLLAQIEDFQKRLWLKKKFVVSTDYLLTIDLVAEELLPQVQECGDQIEQWKEHLAVEQIKNDLTAVSFSEPVQVEFLRDQPHLSVDTRFFPDEFKQRLVAAIPDLDKAVTGVAVQGDNFQVLMLASAMNRGQVDTIYIDPPYNTGGDDFIYKDSYQYSSWMAMMESRLRIAAALLAPTGSFFCSLDDGHNAELRRLIAETTPALTRFGEFVWKTRNTDNRVSTRFSLDHESVHVYANGSSPLLGRVIDRSGFSNPDNDPRGPYTTDPLTGKANAIDRPNLHYTMENPETGDQYPPHPDFGWITDVDGYKDLLEEKRIHWPANPTTGQPRKKRFLSETSERAPISSLGISIKQGEGNKDLSALFGAKLMNFPKPVSVLETVIDCSTPEGGAILDFFAGSGTTGQAVINLNRSNKQHLRFLLAEVGSYFDALLLPRLIKAIHSADWEDGSPVDREGVTCGIKYQRLESYEDALNNLEVRRTSEQQALLESQPGFREDYILRYMLDVETAGSPSLLNVQRFTDPFAYQMEISTGSAGETKLVNVDLVETFNWLLGLRVRHIDTIRGVRIVEGENPDGEKVLVLWRRLSELDNDALDDWFEKQGYNTRDQEYDLVYVNCDNNLENLRRPDQTWKVRLIEEDFHRLMFDVDDV